MVDGSNPSRPVVSEVVQLVEHEMAGHNCDLYSNYSSTFNGVVAGSNPALTHIKFFHWRVLIREVEDVYKFENANVTKDFYMPSSNICSIYELDANSEKNDAMVLGQLKYLFGDPNYITNDLENQFSYVIKATDEKGDFLLLEAYRSGSGPAIGGLKDSSSKIAAHELAIYIRQSKTIDYDYEGYYLDAQSKVCHGIKNGVPYWEETEISAKEFEEFQEEVWY